MYIYDDVRRDVCRLCKKGARCGSIGRSALGAHLVYIHVGAEDGKQIIVTGGVHAREWVTSLVVMRSAFYALEHGSPLGIYFLPMINPDGCGIAQGVLPPDRKEFLTSVNGSEDFSLWKANANAVDLNCNFDAKWGKGKGNLTFPAPSSYVGERPFSESETTALASFTQFVRPVLTVSYHALGHEVYYEFFQRGASLERDERIARYASDLLGYDLVHGDLGSAGGYKDWCISALGISALTLEIVGNNHVHPLDEKDLEGEDILWLPTKLANLMKNI